MLKTPQLLQNFGRRLKMTLEIKRDEGNLIGEIFAKMEAQKTHQR